MNQPTTNQPHIRLDSELGFGRRDGRVPASVMVLLLVVGKRERERGGGGDDWPPQIGDCLMRARLVTEFWCAARCCCVLLIARAQRIFKGTRARAMELFD